MASLTDLSDIINRVTGGSSGTPENLFFFKDSRVAAAAGVTVAGRYTSLWEYNGQPSHGAAPGAVAIPDNTTNGGLKQTDPGGGRQKWLLGATATSSIAGTLIIYDRLLHISGLSGTVTTAQTVGGTLTRYTGTESVGNQIWVEIYTQIGATSTTITANYTDQDGNAGITSQSTAIGNTGLREVQRMIQIPLASGDTGVRAVASVTVAATTGTAGNFGVNIMRPLAYIPISLLGAGSVRDFISGLPSIIEIKTDACLAFQWLANSTAGPQIWGSLHMVEA
jgi:hypothetical protein